MKSFILTVIIALFSLTAFVQQVENKAIIKPSQIVDDWRLKGNLGIDTNVNFLGNVDAKRLCFRTANIERANISSNGLFLIQKLAVNYSQNNVNSFASISVFTGNFGVINLNWYKDKGRIFKIVNLSSTSITLNNTITTVSGSTTTIPNNSIMELYWSGSNFIKVN